MPHADPIARAEYHREWKRRNRARYRDHEANYSRARHANIRARRYGAAGTITVSDVAQVMAVGQCHYCGGTTRLGIDHVAPLHAGGPNTVENLVCCCHACNASKYRQDRPGRWSRLRDACSGCGTSERRHIARGLCAPCYRRAYPRRRR